LTGAARGPACLLILSCMNFEKAEKFIHDKLTRELPRHLFYHSIYHVEDVMDAALRLAKQENIPAADLPLLQIAVLYHDSGFIIDTKNHEEIGCGIARESLPAFGFTPAQIATVCGMIMATRIPQLPHTHLEQILCDADLDYLGREDYDFISNNLFKEMNLYSMLDEKSWLKLQIGFLEKHQYFTPSAISLRQASKDAKLAELKKRYAALT